MKIRFKKIDKLEFLFVLFMTFALMPDAISVLGHSLKPMYLVFLLLFIVLLREKCIVLPNKTMLLFFSFMLGISISASRKWGIDKLFFNYIFGAVVVTMFLSVGRRFREDSWLVMLQSVWTLLLIGIISNDLLQAYRFVEYFQLRLPHPYINTVVAGGVNLEASWLAILVLAFYKNRKRCIPLIASTIISLLYNSRVAIIADILIAFIFIYGILPEDTKKKVFSRRIGFSVVGIIAVSVVISMYSNSDYLLQVISRFKNIGSDPGSLGRLAMWRYVPQIIYKYPLGVGLGNVIEALETVSPLKYTENNIHNIFMQMACELGLLGGIFYLLLWGYWCAREFKWFLKKPIVAMLFIYLILAMFQYKGGESIFFCILGIYFSIKNNKRNI